MVPLEIAPAASQPSCAMLDAALQGAPEDHCKTAMLKRLRLANVALCPRFFQGSEKLDSSRDTAEEVEEGLEAEEFLGAGDGSLHLLWTRSQSSADAGSSGSEGLVQDVIAEQVEAARSVAAATDAKPAAAPVSMMALIRGRSLDPNSQSVNSAITAKAMSGALVGASLALPAEKLSPSPQQVPAGIVRPRGLGARLSAASPAALPDMKNLLQQLSK